MTICVIFREYECGCKITSVKNYPSIAYCPLHKAAPGMCETLRGILSLAEGHAPMPKKIIIARIKQTLALVEEIE